MLYELSCKIYVKANSMEDVVNWWLQEDNLVKTTFIKNYNITNKKNKTLYFNYDITPEGGGIK